MKLLSKIDSKNSIVDLQTLIDIVHPVGSYYWSSDPTSPNELFNRGGVTTNWTQITDRFVLAAGKANMVGSTGGEATHKLTLDEMPSHSHSFGSSEYVPSSNKRDIVNVYEENRVGSSYRVPGISNIGAGWRYVSGTTRGGGNIPHNNMPPYIVAYCWRRIS